MRKFKKTLLIILLVLLVLILTAVGCFYILTDLGKKQFHKEDTHISNVNVTVEDEHTITYNGKKYTLNKNIVSILVLGIDRENVSQNLGAGQNGQADVIFVATIDTKTNKACIIPISRETMTEVDLYTIEGKFAETKTEQLCLAYAYGTTPQQCSENVMKSVKKLLGGININSYVTIEMEGIRKLTELIGGVELTCLEDFVNSKYSFKKGQKLQLKNETATAYIKYRGDDTESNARRMLRQKQFLSALMNKVGNTVLKDFTKLSKFYNTLSPYYKTNVSFAQITYLAQNCLTLNFGDGLNYKTIDGTLEQGEKWVEFYPEEETIIQTVIDVFYNPVK